MHEGMELAQEKDFSATLTQEGFSENLEFPPAPPEFWAGRKEPATLDETKMRQRELG